MSHVFLRQKLFSVDQVEFLHRLSGQILAPIPQMYTYLTRFCSGYISVTRHDVNINHILFEILNGGRQKFGLLIKKII